MLYIIDISGDMQYLLNLYDSSGDLHPLIREICETVNNVMGENTFSIQCLMLFVDSKREWQDSRSWIIRSLFGWRELFYGRFCLGLLKQSQ